VSNDAERQRWGIEKLSVGLSLGGASSAEEWQALLRWVDRAEALGLHSIWVPEMHFATGVSASPLLALAAFAARSSRLRLGTVSLLLPIHDPLRLAEETAALDRLCGGRLILGLGRGFRETLFAAFGIDASEKRDLFDAALAEILEAWDSGSERPLQRPHPPLAVAGFGPKGIAQAARHGLPYLASPLEPIARIAENLRLHRENLPASVDPSSLVVPVMRTVHVAGVEEEAARVAEALRAEARAISSRVPRSVSGVAEADLEDRAVVGCPDRVIDQLRRYREVLGMDLLIVRPQLAGASQREREASLERLAGEVLPRL
jgi:alkanesulfonate monooxygenase SsuD/methylene tetrahydromethanopterin reductase-like flavin-dependent oxidoreductase (luciferase family)